MRLDVSRVSSSIGAVALLLAVGTACSSGPTDDGGNGQPGPASAVAKQGGDQQVATVGTSVAAAPTVKVTDAQNRAVSGVSVTFAVASGGGSVTGATATTDASGVAAVGSWTLGTAAGANTLTASATGVSASVTFSATGQAGPPTDLVKAAGDNQIAPPGTAVNVAPQVTLTDEHGNPVSGHAVTFAVATGGGSVTGGNATTDANGQATVGSWTLGAAGAQTLTATAAGNGVAGNPATFTATAQLDPLEPSQDTTLSGTVTAATLTVAAGVTVTVNGSLTLNVSGAASIAGSIQGDCVDVALNVDGALALTGTLANDCAALPDDDPPTLAIVALGGMTVSGAGTINTSGDFTVTDDPTITDADFAPGGFAAPSSRAIVGPPCLSWGGSPLVFKPAKARKGADLNPDGGNGRRGRTATARCRGDIQLNGALIVGQDGGDGGNGTRSSSAGPTATGGDGGEGGKVILKSAGAVIGSGTIRGGRGGNGGNGTASGIMTRNGPKASSATAIGGNGAMSGLVEVRGKTGISADLVIDVQQGGDGGNGTATGADGEDSDDTDAAQEGGNATATGGRGGDAPDKTLNQSDQGVTGAVTVTGGNGGQGGVAEAIAGKGGDGTTRQNKAGAAGGNLSATGGNGGDANLKALGGAPVGTGGDGGNALVKRGFGGNGWSDCKVQLTSGGAAGNGGSASGMPGSGGSGTPAGSAGETIASNAAGNGGAGGDGYGPATGGTAGADTRTGTKNDAPPVFQDGADGAGCPVPTTWTVKTDVPDHESVLQLTVEPHTILATLEDDQLTLEIGESAFTLQVVTTLVGTSFSGSGGSFVKLTTFGPRSGTVDVMGDLDPTTGMFTAMITLTVFGQPVTYNVSGTYPAESP